MIRVLHLTTDSKIAGAERLLLGIAKNYNKEEFAVYFCSLKSRGELHIQLEKLGQKAFSLNCSNMWGLPLAIFKLAFLLRKYKIDILHTHLYHASILGQFVVKFNKPIIGIITRHYSDLFYIYGNSFQRALDRYASTAAKHIIAISKGVKNVLVGLDRIDPEKITVIYNGIDVTEFDRAAAGTSVLQKSPKDPERKKIIGAVGSLHPRKGHRYLIEAADILCQRRQDLRFVIIGDGALKQELESLRSAFDLEDKVEFIGYRQDIPNLLLGIDIMVQSSIEEGFGLSIIEAMAMNKPVIGTNVGGVPEIIEQGRTGYLIQSKNPVELAEKIDLLLNNDKYREEMGREARKSVEGKFKLIDMINKYETLYKEILNKRNE